MAFTSSGGHVFTVIDAHQHYGNVKDAGVGLHSEVEELDDNEFARRELEARMEALDRRGVDKTVVLAGHSYLRPRGMADTQLVNDRLATYVGGTPERLVAAVGVVEPLYGEAGLPELERCKSLGFVGVSFHGRFQGVSHDSPWVVRYVEHLAQLGMIPFIHAPSDSPEEALWKTEALAHRFPALTIVVLDVFMGFEQCREAISVAQRCPNLVFDTALALDFAFIVPFVRAVGAERLVYGSDLYSWPSGTFAEDGIRQIVESDLDEESKTLVLSGNIERVLSLT